MIGMLVAYDDDSLLNGTPVLQSSNLRDLGPDGVE